MKAHSLTIEYSLGNLESLQYGIEALINDLDLDGIEESSKCYRDYRFVGKDEKGTSLGKGKVCKTLFYKALAENDALRPLLVAYIKKLTAYNFFLGSCSALVAPGEAQIVKDPVYALVDLGAEYIDLYCDAFSTSDRDYDLGFDKPKRQFVRLYPESEEIAILYVAIMVGRLMSYSTDPVLPKPPSAFVARFSEPAYCNYFIQLCAAEFIRNALTHSEDEHHLGLASLEVNKMNSDLDELEEQFTFQPYLTLLLELTNRSAKDILQALKEEVTGIFDGSRNPVKPVLYDFPTPAWVINQYENASRFFDDE